MVVLHIPYGYLDVHDGDGGHEACTQGEGDLQGQDNTQVSYELYLSVLDES